MLQILWLSGICLPHSGQVIFASGRGLPHFLQVLNTPGFLAPHSGHFLGAATSGGLKHIIYHSLHLHNFRMTFEHRHIIAIIVPYAKNPIILGCLNALGHKSPIVKSPSPILNLCP
ncbi:hypothetical protein HMPREF0322_04464 [Desulfitobacterium hafniense DP7]|uniref:Uncharacterized protein n=2 Tax=Desulfitobacterium hafniense TaxID=49338 RepID=Q24N85_DESHY|nr:hypothetical protein HMPREF0322_04464 [Desulfitobacterium hafniense DP7]BAE86507.1 hypothetical protein DSY4718 [Desulfitobacterium hafniense Y51]